MQYRFHFTFEGKQYQADMQFALAQNIGLICSKFHDPELIERFDEEILIYTDSKKVIFSRTLSPELFELKTAIFEAIKGFPGFTSLFVHQTTVSEN